MSLFDDVVKVAQFYMGPAAERFVSRQISGHLKIEPQSLTKAQLPTLADWCLISAELVMDKNKAQEMSQKIKSLT